MLLRFNWQKKLMGQEKSAVERLLALLCDQSSDSPPEASPSEHQMVLWTPPAASTPAASASSAPTSSLADIKWPSFEDDCACGEEVASQTESLATPRKHVQKIFENAEEAAVEALLTARKTSFTDKKVKTAAFQAVAQTKKKSAAVKASAVREAVSAALKQQEQKSQRSTPQQAVAAEKGKSKRSTPQQLEAAEKAKSKRSTPEPVEKKPEGKRRLTPATDETDEPLHMVTITNAKEPPRSYLQGCSCDRSCKPLKHKKRLLVEFSLRRDGANYQSLATRARDYIVKHSCTYTAAREVRQHVC